MDVFCECHLGYLQVMSNGLHLRTVVQHQLKSFVVTENQVSNGSCVTTAQSSFTSGLNVLLMGVFRGSNIKIQCYLILKNTQQLQIVELNSLGSMQMLFPSTLWLSQPRTETQCSSVETGCHGNRQPRTHLIDKQC